MSTYPLRHLEDWETHLQRQGIDTALAPQPINFPCVAVVHWDCREQPYKPTMSYVYGFQFPADDALADFSCPKIWHDAQGWHVLLGEAMPHGIAGHGDSAHQAAHDFVRNAIAALNLSMLANNLGEYDGLPF